MMAELQNDVDLLEQLFNNQQQQLQQMQQQLQKLLKQKSDKYEDNYKLYLTNNGGYGIVMKEAAVKRETISLNLKIMFLAHRSTH